MARPIALAAALAVSLLAVSGAGGAGAQTPKRGGTVVFAQLQPEPACLNHLLEQRCAPGNAFLSLERITHRVLEAPFDIGPDFTWRPQLVSGATFTRKPPFVLTYHIRPEARWSDGVPVTARDFVFTLRAIRSHGAGGIREYHRAIRSLRIVDAKTLRVVLGSRLAAWKGLFGSILPSHALRGEAFADVWRDRIDDPKTGAPIASGPFLVGSWDRGRQLTLIPNPRYWGRHPAYLGRLVIRFGVDATTVADALRTGEIHVASAFPTAGALVRAARQSGSKIGTKLSTGWEHLEFRLESGGNPLLQNKTVRRAIAYGIDRVAIVRQFNRESSLRWRVLDSTVFLSKSRYYRPNWNRYRYSPLQAQRLLEGIGCRRGSDEIYACDGARLSFRFFTHPAPGSIRPVVLELIRSQLRRAGIEVLPTFAPQGVVFGPDGIYARGEFDVALFAWVGQAPDLGVSDLLGCGRESNYTGYCQRLVTRDLDQADRIIVPDRRAQTLNRADAQIAKDVPYLPLFQNPKWTAYAPAVRGITVFPDPDELAGAEDWWLER